MLAWMGDLCSLLSGAPRPHLLMLLPFLQEKGTLTGSPGYFAVPITQGRGQTNGSCVEPDWGCYPDGRKPDSREEVCSGYGGVGGTPECRARAGRKLSKMLSEADRDISAALLFPFC